jgi:hypothetical protein
MTVELLTQDVWWGQQPRVIESISYQEIKTLYHIPD